MAEFVVNKTTGTKTPKFLMSPGESEVITEYIKTTTQINYQDLITADYQPLVRYIEKVTKVAMKKGKNDNLKFTKVDDRCRISFNGSRCENRVRYTGKVQSKDPFCKYHKSVLTRVGSYLNGSICEVANCTGYVAPGSKTSKCRLHLNVMNDDDDTADEENEEYIQNDSDYEDEDEKVHRTLTKLEEHSIECELVKILDTIIDDVNEKVTTVIYIGASNYRALLRCLANDHFKKKSLEYNVREMVKSSNNEVIKYAEFFCISYLSGKLGDHRLVNKVGGGGGLKSTKGAGVVYLLTWVDDEFEQREAKYEKQGKLNEKFILFDGLGGGGGGGLKKTKSMSSRHITAALELKFCSNIYGAVGISLTFANKLGYLCL